MVEKSPGIRARARAELTQEIKRAAGRQLAEKGAAALSLRAVARELGMASSAMYRYFSSREELLTALIIDAYNEAGQIVEDADASMEREDVRGRWIAMAKALRAWAKSSPHKYALIYGSPVPGYAAPEDTINPATRIPVALLTALFEGLHGGDTSEQHTAVGIDEQQLLRMLHGLSSFTGHIIEPHVLSLGVQSWSELFGFLNLELFGHFTNAVDDPDAYFEYAMANMVDRLLSSASP